jgi:hypothetical protein
MDAGLGGARHESQSVRVIFLVRCGAVGVLGLRSADAVEGVEVLGVGVGVGVEVHGAVQRELTV